MSNTVELGGPLIDRPTVTLLTEEVNRLNVQATNYAAELNARADLLIAMLARLEGVAQVCDNNGHEVIAEAIRDAMRGPEGHPDHLGRAGVSSDGHPTGEPLEDCACSRVPDPVPSCFKCKFCGRKGSSRE